MTASTASRSHPASRSAQFDQTPLGPNGVDEEPQLHSPHGGLEPDQTRAAWRHWEVPLTVLAELLYRDAATPYRAAKKFGLQQWLAAQVRDFLTKGAWFAGDLDIERAIRFNTAYLKRRAQFVAHRRQTHRGRPLDGVALARLLGVPESSSTGGFFAVWSYFVDSLAEDLVQATRDGHAGEVPWMLAERFLDQVVAPRSRKLRHLSLPRGKELTPSADLGPVSLTAGLKQIQFLLCGLSSPDPLVVAETARSWQADRLRDGESCGLPAWAANLSEL